MQYSPLIPPAARPAAIAILAVCHSTTAFLGGRYLGQTQAGWFDTAVDRRLQAVVGGESATMLRIVQLGDMIPVAAMTCVLMALCLATRRPPAAVLVAVAVPGAGAISEFLLKPLLHRTLGGALSFPSGHATGIVALAVTLAVLMLNPHRPRLPGCLRATIALGGLGAAGVIGVAIVGARTHYATDAIGGMTVATSVVLLTALIVDWFMAARLGRDR